MREGDVIGGYILERHLGKGGMGQVWLGRDPHSLEEVAVKGLKDGFDQELAARFDREMSTLVSLEHENIVKLHRVIYEGGMPYVAMEYIHGPNLRERKRTIPPLTPDQKVSLLAQVLAAMVYLRETANVVHRDIKPSNVLIDGDNRAVLADFGLAKFHDLNLTSSAGVPQGTARYLAPEVGEFEQATYRSDVYSFGVMAMELFAEKHPTIDGIPEERFAGPLSDLIRSSVSRQPENRPTAAELLHAFENVRRLGYAAACRMEKQAADDLTAPVGAASLGQRKPAMPPQPQTEPPAREEPEPATKSIGWVYLPAAAAALAIIAIPAVLTLAQKAQEAAQALDPPSPSASATVAEPAASAEEPVPLPTMSPITSFTVVALADDSGILTNSGETRAGVMYESITADGMARKGNSCNVRVLVTGPEVMERGLTECLTPEPIFFALTPGTYQVLVSDEISGAQGETTLVVNP